MFEPWIRKVNYSKDYFEYAYQTYINQHNASYPCTYYSVDIKNSVLENENLLAGTYEKWGVGELSGMRWRKIYMFPLMTFNQIQPQMDSDELGLSYRQSIDSTTSFPDKYKNLKPTPGDIIDPNFAIKNDAIAIKPLLIVSNVNLAHIGDNHNVFELQLKVAPFTKVSLEKQISSYWHFYDLTKTILPLQNVSILSKISNRFMECSSNLKTTYHRKTTNVLLEWTEED